MPKKIIHFVGHSCTGKSTLVKALKEKLPGWYVVSYDAQKWQLAQYTRVKDSDVIKEITKGLFGVVCKLGLNILSLAVIGTETEYKAYEKVATLYGYEIVSVELTAPKEILLARFRERVESAKRTGYANISVTDEKIFLENLSKPFFVPPGTVSFDTSLLKSEEIVNEIIGILKK